MKSKLILGLALVLSGLISEGTTASAQPRPEYILPALLENGAKLGCYFTLEYQSFSVTGEASLVQKVVTTNSLSADSIPAFVANLRKYLDGCVVVEDSTNPKILHIIDKTLAADPNYLLNKSISLKYSGGLRPTYSTESLTNPPVGGLIPALAQKAGHIMSAPVDSASGFRSAFDFTEPNFQLSIDATNQTVRSIMADSLPLGKKPILWRAVTHKYQGDQGEVWVWVEYW